MEHISFFLTQEQVKRREKTVTRRSGKKQRRPGQILLGVVKSQGRKPGEPIEPLCVVEVVSVRKEPLDRMISEPAYGRAECRSEGFPELSPVQFTVMYREHNGGPEDQQVSRIEFKYREDLFEEHLRKEAFGGQACYSVSIPLNPQEPTMAKKDKETTPKASGKKGKGAAEEGEAQTGSEQPAGQEGGEKKPEQVTKMPAVKTLVEAYDATVENLPTFQKVVFVEFSEHEYAEHGKKMAQIDAEVGQMETDKKADVAEWNEKIEAKETERKTISAMVLAKGAEKEVECAKRINEKDQTVTIFDVNSLEIIEVRKLGKDEMQTELRFQQAARQGQKTKTGTFPKDQKVGAHAKDNPAVDAKNDEAVRKLAEASKS